MKIKVGINGMGRIGRMIIRSIVENNYSNFEIKHINNRTNSETCSNLLKYDSIHGKFDAEIKFDQNNLIVNNNKITFSQETDINKIDWKKFNVDYVFECTGKFNSKDKFTPNASRASALPLFLVLLLFPCLATTAPAAEAMIAAHVEILNVLIPFPPVLHVSIEFIGAEINFAFSRIARAAPAISSTLTPFACNNTNIDAA